MSLLNQYSDDEFTQIVRLSTSYMDLSKKLGYNSYSGDLIATFKERIEQLNIDTSHFNRVERIDRNEDNIFIEDSTASQKTLRKWYVKGEYTPYICSICGQPPEWQGKPLTLILDHINGNNHDDRLDNLRWVCPNCNQQLDTTGARNINKIRLKKLYYCVDCGKEISSGSTRCLECYQKSRVIPQEQMLVSREELKDLIRSMPFTQIGKRFGVSDNAVRKWCDKYHLPRKSSEIKKYSNEDWSKI